MEPEPKKESLIDCAVRAAARVMVVLILAGFITMVFLHLTAERFAAREPYIPRIQADMRSLATCIESYFADHGAYPVASSGAAGANNLPGAAPEDLRLSTFRIKTSPEDPLHTLTTPVSYCLEYFADPFANPKGATFGYYSVAATNADDGSTTHGWIIWCKGPDRDYDIDPASDYNPSSHPTTFLIKKTYDPTNGAKSDGDVWRAKQEYLSVLEGARGSAAQKSRPNQ